MIIVVVDMIIMMGMIVNTPMMIVMVMRATKTMGCCRTFWIVHVVGWT